MSLTLSEGHCKVISALISLPFLVLRYPCHLHFRNLGSRLDLDLIHSGLHQQKYQLSQSSYVIGRLICEIYGVTDKSVTTRFTISSISLLLQGRS